MAKKAMHLEVAPQIIACFFLVDTTLLGNSYWMNELSTV
jgi:hypothetical protein